MALEIRTIDYVERVIVTADDDRLPIVDLFDAFGRPTREASAGVLGLAGHPGGWVSFCIRPFERSRLQ